MSRERPPALSIEAELVEHECPWCALDFDGYGQVDDETARYLKAAHEDCLRAEATIRHARRRLHATTAPARAVRDLWASQEDAAQRALERVHVEMRRRIAGEPESDFVDLWS